MPNPMDTWLPPTLDWSESWSVRRGQKVRCAWGTKFGGFGMVGHKCQESVIRPLVPPLPPVGVSCSCISQAAAFRLRPIFLRSPVLPDPVRMCLDFHTTPLCHFTVCSL